MQLDYTYSITESIKNHLYQLLGYAIILEDVYNRNVDKGFVYLIPKEDAVVFDLTGKVKEETKSASYDEAIKKIIFSFFCRPGSSLPLRHYPSCQ